MKKSQGGFTLIELVIVIVILGILAVTAAPKFIDLTSDATAATLKGVKGSLEGANNMIFSKSIIDGVTNKQSTSAGENGYPYLLTWGYLRSHGNFIAAFRDATGLAINEWDFEIVGDTSTTITPAGSTKTDCNVLYEDSTAEGVRPKITVTDTGC